MIFGNTSATLRSHYISCRTFRIKLVLSLGNVAEYASLLLHSFHNGYSKI